MKRLHTARRSGTQQGFEKAAVYALAASTMARNDRPTPAKREVYWCNTPVELYTFDAAYLARLRARHPETLSHFGMYFTRLLTLKLRRAGLPNNGGDDIRQETLLRVLKAVEADKVEEPEKLGPYVFSVCRRVTQEWWRDEGSGWSLENDEAYDFPDPADGPEERVRNEELRKTATWVLEQVAKKDRQILIAVFLDERDKDDICREFNVSRAYLRVLVHRALRSAKEKLGEGKES
jgi:RNA polymerase sigma-70 factor, ECF subfamily